MDRLRPHAEDLGSAAEFDGLEDILENGTGSARQALIYEANHDLREVVREIVDATVPEAAETLGD
jgi:carboxylate-amine ligase